MTESINNEVFFYHSKGDERSSFHLKLMMKVILYGYSKKVNPREGLKIYSAKIFPQSGSQLDKKSTNVQ